MRVGLNEIIEELTEDLWNFGGKPDEWCVRTAKDPALNGRLPIQDSRETSPRSPGLGYREVHTPYAATATWRG